MNHTTDYQPLTTTLANSIYNVLVNYAGASELNREYFVQVQTYDFVGEFRFCGSLGFGGKFWRDSDRFYVTCYREDETPERIASIEMCNDHLRLMYFVDKL